MSFVLLYYFLDNIYCECAMRRSFYINKGKINFQEREFLFRVNNKGTAFCESVRGDYLINTLVMWNYFIVSFVFVSMERYFQDYLNYLMVILECLLLFFIGWLLLNFLILKGKLLILWKYLIAISVHNQLF